jgi:flagellar protein FlgJ
MTQLGPIDRVIGAATDAAAQLEKLKKAAQDVEAVFLKDLLAVMRRSVPKSEIGGSMGAEMYQDMLDQALAESVASQGSFGIGRMLYRQLAPAVGRDAFVQALRARDAAPSPMNSEPDDSHPEPKETTNENS